MPDPDRTSAGSLTHTLIQITDPHVGRTQHGVDGHVAVERALAAVEASVRPAALLFTGDLVDHATPEEYRTVRDLVAPVAARLGAPAVFVAGNHDDPAVLREHLLGEPPHPGTFDHAVRVGDLRIVVLDSHVPGRAYGELRPAQLGWLRAELASPAPAGTVLALHHPPLPNADPLTAAMELRNPADLAAAIAGTDVRIVLAGHTHVTSAGALAGVPVWTGGAASFVVDALPPDGGARGLRTTAISRIDLFDGDDGRPGPVLATAVPLDAEPLFTVPADVHAEHVRQMRAELPAP